MSKIGVFDSGIGGLTVLEELKKSLPKEDFIFYADSINNPYGEKTDEELNNITSNIVDFLIDKGCRIIVIACNTATTRCIHYLREKYPNIVFIGTEPAVKVACDDDYHTTLVMATPATIQSERLQILIHENQKDLDTFYLVPCFGLADAIEQGDVAKQEEIVENIYNGYKDCDIESIVLGCTHYPHIKDLISKYFVGVALIDGNEGVAKETKRQMEKHKLITNSGTCDVEFIKTK
jgi:glutamate racemase